MNATVVPVMEADCLDSLNVTGIDQSALQQSIDGGPVPGKDYSRSIAGKRFAKVCQLLGASEKAQHGWAKIHVKPHIGCLTWACSFSLALGILATLQIGGIPWGIPLMNACGIISVATAAVSTAMIRRMGPEGAATQAYMVLSGVLAISVAVVEITAVAGPIRFCPFRNRLLFAVVDSVAIFASMVAALNGGSSSDHPAEPHTSIWPSIAKAAFSSLRLVDCLTDIGFVRILVTQVCLCGTPCL